ncbi:MAG TPA: Holliday junction resolvase Hjc [Candidatus Nanoarchaeia archaeon]|nr:Holliday junction resolvase Hjc [Candidatus Nanoarchaeia archaeon]
MNTKAKGTAGERELIHFLNDHGWSAIRSAGSGSMKYPSPDILAGNAIRRLAIECKVTKDKNKYFPPEELEQLKTFSQNFGAEAWIGIKFAGEEWYFLMIEDLENTGVNFGASVELAKRRGLTKEELIETDNSNNKGDQT